MRTKARQRKGPVAPPLKVKVLVQGLIQQGVHTLRFHGDPPLAIFNHRNVSIRIIFNIPELKALAEIPIAKEIDAGTATPAKEDRVGSHHDPVGGGTGVHRGNRSLGSIGLPGGEERILFRQRIAELGQPNLQLAWSYALIERGQGRAIESFSDVLVSRKDRLSILTILSVG